MYNINKFTIQYLNIIYGVVGGNVWTSKPVVRVYFIGDIQLSLQQLDEQDPAVVIFR